MFMAWQLFALLNIFGYSVTTILQKHVIKESTSRPITYTIFFQLFTGIVIACIGFALHGITFAHINLTIGLFLLLGTFLYAFGNLFIFKSLKATEASKFTIIYSTRVLFTVIVATLFLSETFGIKEIFGTLLLFTGIIIISLKSKKFTFNKGDLYALIAAILFGLVNANARFLLQSIPVFTYMLFVFFPPTILLSFLYPNEAKHGSIFFKKNGFIKMTLLAVVYALANFGFFQALKLGPSASLVASVVLISVIVTVLLSIIFLNERKHMWKKLLGALISFIGLVILTI